MAPTRRKSSRGAAWLVVVLLALVTGAGCERQPSGRTVVNFWAMGSEAERLATLVEEFEQLHPELDVRVQQIPWSAAHEKLLTAFAGDTLPDACQLGNTWIAEFAALDSLADLSDRVAASTVVRPANYFPGSWKSNVIDGATFGVPWYCDTRLLFYRTDLLAAAGHDHPPRNWDEWLTMMRDLKSRQPPGGYAILLPINEFEQPVILGMQNGADMLSDGGRYGNFRAKQFRDAFEFYVGLFREGLAPPSSNTQISNVWQEFERGTFAMYVSGPWNVTEFRRRLDPSMKGKWTTAALPARTGEGPGVSTAGGCSLALFRGARNPDGAWTFIEFLSERRQQVGFYRLSSNLPARVDAWTDASLVEDQELKAFHEQLAHTRPVPQAPEWEQIATGELVKTVESVITGGANIEKALERLDRRVDDILQKRRWMLARRESEAQP